MTLAASSASNCTSNQMDVLAIAKEMGLRGTFVKIGTFSGHFAVEIMRVCEPKRLFCLDPFESYEEFRDSVKRKQHAEKNAEAHERLAPFGDRVEFIRMYSEHAAKNFADGALDFVYIAGTKVYDYVLKDFQYWYPKVRDGGFIGANNSGSAEDEGVLKAAQEFAESVQAKLYLVGTQCVIYKGRDIAAPK